MRVPVDRVAKRDTNDGDDERRRGQPDALVASDERRPSRGGRPAGPLDASVRAGWWRRSPRTTAGPPRIATPSLPRLPLDARRERTAANGIAAANLTIATMTWSTIQPGKPTTVATSGGAPSRLAAPASIATTPPSIAAGTRGRPRG